MKNTKHSKHIKHKQHKPLCFMFAVFFEEGGQWCRDYCFGNVMDVALRAGVNRLAGWCWSSSPSTGHGSIASAHGDACRIGWGREGMLEVTPKWGDNEFDSRSNLVRLGSSRAGHSCGECLLWCRRKGDNLSRLPLHSSPMRSKNGENRGKRCIIYIQTKFSRFFT